MQCEAVGTNLVCCETGKWTVQQAAELSVAAPTMAAALDGRFMSGLKEERVAASKLYHDHFQLQAPGPVPVPPHY